MWASSSRVITVWKFVEPSRQRSTQQIGLGFQSALCHRGENLGVAFPGAQGVEDHPARHPERVGRDRRQLDVGVFQQFLQSLHLSCSFLGQLTPITGDLSQLGDLRRRHEAAPQQAAFQQLSDPRGVVHIGFAARHVLDVGRQEEGAAVRRPEARSAGLISPARVPGWASRAVLSASSSARGAPCRRRAEGSARPGRRACRRS